MGYGATATATTAEGGRKKKKKTTTDALFSIKLNFFPGKGSLHLSLDGADGSPLSEDEVFGHE